MKKGITPAVATVLLITVTIAAGGTLYTLVNDNINQATDQETDIPLNIGGLSAESCYTDDGNTRIVLRNSGQETVNASKLNVLLEGRLKADEEYSVTPSIVDPQQTFELEIDALIGSSTQVTLTDGSQEFTHNCFSLGETELYETSFEISGEEWTPFTTNKTITNASTSATDSVSIGEEALKAGRIDGVGGHKHPPGGHGGMAKSFNTNYDVLELDFRAVSDQWGRNTIMIKNQSDPGYEVLWIKNAQPSNGGSYDTGWQTKTFDISKYPAEFTLVIGNDDDSTGSDYPSEPPVHEEDDHTWTIWADDIELAKTN